MYDEQHLTHDGVISESVTIDSDNSGVVINDSGDVGIDWDSVERVQLDTSDSFSEVPHAYAFDSTEFFKLDATVTQPMPQPYIFNDDVIWLKKPRSALQRAAWSLDNKPVTLQHPDTQLVSDVDDIHGFWNNTRYETTTDELKSSMHIPVDDMEAREFIEQNNDVSVGFRNRVTRLDDFDGTAGGTGPDVTDASQSDIELDGYQTNIYFDHGAVVEEGRCSGEDGCGIDGADAYKGTVITNSVTDATSVLTQKNQTDSKFTHEGSWYAVPPSDNPDDEWKYVIDDCSDAEDAWKLRNHGDLSISVSTLEDRIKRRASDLECDIDFNTETDTMTEGCDGCSGSDGGINVNFDDLSADVALDKIAAENDTIDDKLTELREKAAVADAVTEELDCDLGDASDTVGVLDERVEELQETVEDLQEPQMREDAEAIVKMTDRFGEDADAVMESLDSDPEAIADKRELLDDITDGTTEQTANVDSSPDNESESSAVGGYVASPWD